jgi:hypothetical protein
MSRPVFGADHNLSLPSTSVSTSSTSPGQSVHGPLLDAHAASEGQSSSGSDSPRATTRPTRIVLPNEVHTAANNEDTKARAPVSPFTAATGATPESPFTAAAASQPQPALARTTTMGRTRRIHVTSNDSAPIEGRIERHRRRGTVAHKHGSFEHSTSGLQGGNQYTMNGPSRFGYDNYGRKVDWMKAFKIQFQRMWILNPKSPWRSYWNLSIFIILMYYIIEIPLRLGFHLDNCNSCSTTILHLLCDIFFCVDCLFIQMRTSYFVEDSNQSILEHNPKRIMITYLRGWFTLDILTSLPIHHIVVYYIDVADSANVYVSAFVQFAFLARMLKVIRFMDLLHYYHSVELSAGTMVSDLLKVLKFIFGFFLTAHMSACMWMFIALQEREDGNLPAHLATWDVMTWPGNLGYTKSPNMTEVMAEWGNVSSTRLGSTHIFNAMVQEQLAEGVVPLTVDISYLMALYWSVSTMTTVGYGDMSVTPTHAHMRGPLYCLIALLHLHCLLFVLVALPASRVMTSRLRTHVSSSSSVRSPLVTSSVTYHRSFRSRMMRTRRFAIRSRRSMRTWVIASCHRICRRRFVIITSTRGSARPCTTRKRSCRTCPPTCARESHST